MHTTILGATFLRYDTCRKISSLYTDQAIKAWTRMRVCEVAKRLWSTISKNITKLVFSTNKNGMIFITGVITGYFIAR